MRRFDNAIAALDEFEQWIHDKYEQSGDDETILGIMVQLDEIRNKHSVQKSK